MIYIFVFLVPLSWERRCDCQRGGLQGHGVLRGTPSHDRRRWGRARGWRSDCRRCCRRGSACQVGRNGRRTHAGRVERRLEMVRRQLLVLLHGRRCCRGLPVVQFEGGDHRRGCPGVAEGRSGRAEEVWRWGAAVRSVEAVQGRQVARLGQQLEADAGRSLPLGPEQKKQQLLTLKSLFTSI